MKTLDRHYSTSAATRVRPRTLDRLRRRVRDARGDAVIPVMGVADRGARLDIFGESDLGFVDSLFTNPRRNHD